MGQTARYPRTLNRRGESTRDRFLDALAHQLETVPWRRIEVVSLARSIGQSPASFYCYWLSIEAAAVELVARMRESGETLPRHLLLVYRLLEFEAREMCRGDDR